VDNLLHLPYTVLKASPGAAIFGQEMFSDIPFIADWKIGEHRQRIVTPPVKMRAGLIMICQVGQKVLVQNNGILHKAELRYLKEPWTIMSFIQMEQSGFNAKTNLKG
jgi:hypothetical protein